MALAKFNTFEGQLLAERVSDRLRVFHPLDVTRLEQVVAKAINDKAVRSIVFELFRFEPTA
jgi:hypothetical protein